MRMHDAEIKLPYALGLGSASRVHGLYMYIDRSMVCHSLSSQSALCWCRDLACVCVCVRTHVHVCFNSVL